MKNSIKKKEIKEFYDNIYKKGDIRDNIRLYCWVISLINPRPLTRLLDVGCGVGCLLSEATKRNITSYGLDISYESLLRTKSILPEIEVCVADGEKIPFKNNSFDTVVSLGSIEHFSRPEEGVKEIARVLKVKGRAALILPNSFYLEDILRVLFKGMPNEQWQIQERLLSKEKWSALIKENGLGVEKIYGYNKYPELFQEGTYKIKSIRKYIKKFVIKYFCPLNFSWQFLYLCRKIND